MSDKTTIGNEPFHIGMHCAYEDLDFDTIFGDREKEAWYFLRGKTDIQLTLQFQDNGKLYITHVLGHALVEPVHVYTDHPEPTNPLDDYE